MEITTYVHVFAGMGSPWLLGMPFIQQFTSGWDTEVQSSCAQGQSRTQRVSAATSYRGSANAASHGVHERGHTSSTTFRSGHTGVHHWNSIVPRHSKFPSHRRTGQWTVGKRELVRGRRRNGIGQTRLWNRTNSELWQTPQRRIRHVRSRRDTNTQQRAVKSER